MIKMLFNFWQSVKTVEKYEEKNCETKKPFDLDIKETWYQITADVCWITDWFKWKTFVFLNFVFFMFWKTFWFVWWLIDIIGEHSKTSAGTRLLVCPSLAAWAWRWTRYQKMLMIMNMMMLIIDDCSWWLECCFVPPFGMMMSQVFPTRY